MQSIPSLIVLDMAAAVIMIVLATLSRRLGEALKIRPYYRLLYVGVGLLITASLINAAASTTTLGVARALSHVLPEALRFIAGTIGVASCLRYWKWLFSEYLKK